MLYLTDKSDRGSIARRQGAAGPRVPTKQVGGVLVADVISLDKKKKHAEAQLEARTRRRKIQAVQKVFQCTHCAFKCEKCGTQIDEAVDAQAAPDGHRVPYRFCGGCMEEYVDYIERLRGKGDPEAYWHNDAWMTMWRGWIDYQSNMDRYLKSKEFVRLMQELKQTRPED